MPTAESGLADMSDQNLMKIWNLLKKHTWSPGEMHDVEANISMDEWARMVYEELVRREKLKKEI
jgi:hypothetical protein